MSPASLAQPLPVELEAAISEYVTANGEEANAQVQKIAYAVLQGEENVLQVVIALQDYLTSEDEIRRSRGTLLLAEVAEQAASALNAVQLDKLASFFQARLSDWLHTMALPPAQHRPTLAAAARGCTALLARKRTSTLQPLDAGQAAALLSAFLREVHVQSFSVRERQACLELWLTALQTYGRAAALQGVDVLEGTIAAIDGEKDPRCLLLAFRCVATAAQLYSMQGSGDHGLDAAALQHAAPELCDVLSCYFPIQYTPPKAGPANVQPVIAREELVSELHAAMAAAPAFAEHCVPLLLEKLSSSLARAKLDALALLPECCRGYGPEAMRPHLAPLWLAAKTEITAAASSAADLGPSELQRAQELSAAAQAALTSSIRRLGPQSLDLRALADPLMADLQQHLQLAAAPLGPRAAAAVASSSAILAAVAAALPATFQAVWTRVLQQVLTNLDAVQQQVLPLKTGPAAEPAAEQVAAAAAAGAGAGEHILDSAGDSAAANLHVLHSVLAAVAAAREQQEWQEASAAADFHPQLCQVLAAVQALSGWLSAATAAAHSPPASLRQCQVLLLQLWQDLVACGCALPEAVLQPAAQQLAGLAVTAAQEAVAVKYGWKGEQQVHSAAAATLQALQQAGSLQGPALVQVGRVLVGHMEAGRAEWQVQRALQLLADLAAGSRDAAQQALSGLQMVVVQALAALLSTEQKQQQLLQLLQLCLDCLADKLLPALSSDAATAEGISAVLAALLATVEFTPAAAEARLPVNLVAACSSCAAKLAAACTSEQQTSHFTTACEWVTAYTADHAQQQQHTAAAGASSSLCSAADLRCCLAAAVLTALQPALVQGPSAQQLQRTTSGLLSIATSASTTAAVAGCAAVALGALLNKCKDAAALQELMDPVLQGLLSQPASVPGAAVGQQRGRQLLALSWVARGLAMRSHPAVTTIVQHAVQLLSAGAAAAAGSSSNSSSGGSSEALSGAAELFDVLVPEAAQQQGLRLSKAANCQVKVLWQQRAFTTAVATLKQALEQQQQPQQQAPLLLALAFLLQGAPPALLKQEPELVVRLLVRALAELHQPSVATQGRVPAVLQGLLRLLSSFLLDGKLRQLLQEEQRVGDLLAALQGLARLPGASAIREAALQVLASAMELPYHLLHPHRGQVLKTLSMAVDDDRRTVRLAAVKCRQVWSMK